MRLLFVSALLLTVCVRASLAASIPTLVDDIITQSASSGGWDVGLAPGTSLSPYVSQALTVMEDAAASGAGEMALGNPMTWAGIGAFAAGAGIAGVALCLTTDSSLCTAMEAPFSPSTSSGPWKSAIPYLPNPWTMNPGDTVYCEGYGSFPGFCGGDQQAVELQVNSAYANKQPCVAQSNGSEQCGSGVITINFYAAPSSTGEAEIPPGGISCANGDVYPSNGQPWTCAEAVGSPAPSSNVSVFSTPLPSVISPVGTQPANPQVIADIANGVEQQIAGGSTTTWPGSAGPGGASVAQANPLQVGSAPAPITAQQVQEIEAQTGNFPDLNDWFTPAAPNDVVTTSPSTGQPTASTDISVSSPNDGSVSTSQENAAPPCGNLIAGQPECATTLDFKFNPETGEWEWMGDLVDDPHLPSVPNTSILQETQTQTETQTKTLPDIQTGTQTATDTLTDPKTATQTLTDTMPDTEVGTDTLVSPAPDVIPDITLPFDEWPQVINSLPSLPDLSGQCPTMTFHSDILKQTFTVDAQCVLMDTLKPYMSYVLPPTYLFMAFLFLMAA
jgi:hypothetical protein